jgi:DNA/RNA-binding domain of Phe-tRNA-synthetase-like protein
LRRIANKKSLYQINNVVDLLNLVSIESGFSIGGYNVSKIQGEINFGIGKEAENYQGIGRGDLNIVNLPVFRDELGAFGSPTSDSVRTSITTDCKIFLMIIISFQKEEGLQKAINHAVNLLTQYANATQIETQII